MGLAPLLVEEVFPRLQTPEVRGHHVFLVGTTRMPRWSIAAIGYVIVYGSHHPLRPGLVAAPLKSRQPTSAFEDVRSQLANTDAVSSRCNMNTASRLISGSLGGRVFASRIVAPHWHHTRPPGIGTARHARRPPSGAASGRHAGALGVAQMGPARPGSPAVCLATIAM